MQHHYGFSLGNRKCKLYATLLYLFIGLHGLHSLGYSFGLHKVKVLHNIIMASLGNKK